MRTRFAPSPTGDLHLGGALTALGSWWLARRSRGSTVLRVEDLDAPRVVPGAEARLIEDLAWLGLDWDARPSLSDAVPGRVPAPDGGPFRQSERSPLYDEALAALALQGRTYPCDCSRADIARIASAPHEGLEVLYPGTCRDKDRYRLMKRAPAVRLRVEPEDAISWVDGVVGEVPASGTFGTRGPYPQASNASNGDFVLRRGDGVYAYQLAVSVDDLAMGVTGVVRGDDLLASTARQLLLMRLFREGLGAPALSWATRREPPRYWHLPLVRAADGSRLAKRTKSSTVRELRAQGVPKERVVGVLGYALGILDAPVPLSAAALVDVTAHPPIFRPRPWRWPARWE